MRLARVTLIWAALAAAVCVPIAAAAASPLLAWRGPVYILAGFAGIIALGLMLVQPLLIAGYLPGLSARIGRRAHHWIGGALVVAVVIHVGGLWITSPPDMIDALLFSSPTPFSPWGVIAMWAIFAVALLAALRRRLGLRPRTWRIAHMLLAIVIVVGSVVHGILIEGTMETMSKAALCALVLAATIPTVPSTMVFDDHDVHDDWNISEAWVREMRELPWWRERITGAFMAYWIYQHLGNLAPPELAEEALFREVLGDDDAGPRLRRFAQTVDHETTASRFAFHRDFGRSRLVVVDSRAARVLAEGRRDMVDAGEWDWIVQHARGSYDHLVIASTVPVFTARHPLPRGLERGGLRRPLGRPRRAAGREAPPRARPRALAGLPALVRQMVELLGELASGESGTAPGSIVLIGGDVHTAYIAEVELGGDQVSPVYQVVCSPFRNPLGPKERRVVKLMRSRPAALLARGLARTAGVRRPQADWQFRSSVTFDNSIAVLDLDERAATVTISGSRSGDEGGPGSRSCTCASWRWPRRRRARPCGSARRRASTRRRR